MINNRFISTITALTFCLACLSVSAQTAAPDSTETEPFKRLVKKPGQNGYELLLEVSNLPIPEESESFASLRERILASGGRIVQENENAITAHGVLENGNAVQFNATYFFTDGEFSGYPETITGTRLSPGYQERFFNHFADLCGSVFQGYSSFPDDPEHDFYGKLLTASITTCTEDEIRIPFQVGDDQSRTWIITRTSNDLTLKHDHRHADGTPDEITNYGGTTADYGSEYSQSFPADAFTAELIPAAATNVWTLSLSEDKQSLTYYLERNNRPRFKAELQLQNTQAD